VRADPGHLTQVIMNLAVNARDAMPQGGTLSIRTENRQFDKSEAWRIGLSRPGPYVVLRVRVTGCGMDQQTLSRLFEPFFTTKEKGKGTGLGLATVYGIVQQSGGHVTVTSAPGDGTEFCLYFPAVDAVPGPKPEARAAAPIEAGHETILVLEDEDQVRRFVRSALKQQGYEVLEASRESEAVELANEYKNAIHLLLTDVVLPEMAGKDLVQRLTTTRPGLKVLYMSGYSDESMLQRGMAEAGMPFLNKPFTPAALGRKVREILDAPRVPLPSI
ncbi:MAG: response regulator, partial [Acidobacteria bacterium]|nr:response regulator [Acidobacteriota bacterium]